MLLLMSLFTFSVKHRTMSNSKIEIVKICNHVYCKKEYTASSLKSKFCSKNCYKADWARRKRESSRSNSRPKSTEVRIKEKITNQSYFTVADICAFTGACRKTVYRAIKEFEETKGSSGLKAKRFGRGFIISKSNFDDFLNR